MISVVEARRLILSALPTTQLKPVDINSPVPAILKQPLVADRPLPPFDRVSMDGIAISAAAVASGVRKFFIQSCQAAGEPPQTLNNASSCIEIMTGAVLPIGCDAVVRYEDLMLSQNDQEKSATILQNVVVDSYSNVHRAGSDCPAVTVLVHEGTQLFPPQWAIAASVGMERLFAREMPRVAILATGDELVAVDQTPLPHQIRSSNIHAVHAALRLFGVASVSMAHVRDDLKKVQAKLDELLSSHDLLITLGGVSKGRFDYLPAALNDLKVKKIFHEVRQRPGKPLWFGIGELGQPVFGLPGNPVSVLVNLYAHVMPSLRKMIQAKESPTYARLSESVRFDKAMTLYQPVSLTDDRNAVTWGCPVRHNGSGDFAALSGTDGFVELPEDLSEFAREQSFRLYRWDRP